MNSSILLGLIHNAALLMALALVYDLFEGRSDRRGLWLQQVFTGAILGLIGMLIMLTPWQLAPGIFFDTRSVLLAVSGLFFGSLPTTVAMLMTGALRLYQGGAGAWTGTLVICVSGAVGIAWRRWRYNRLKHISPLELYVFGLIVHINMLLCMLTLPDARGPQVLQQISLPVLLIYPVGTLLLGLLLLQRLVRRQAEIALQTSEARYRTTLLSVGDAVISTDIQGRVELMNPVAETLTGWTQAEGRGRLLNEVFNIINEKTRQPVENPVVLVLRQGGVVGLANHTLLVDRNGGEHPIVDSGAPIRSADGQIRGVVLVFRDQGKERAALQSLQESEERFRQLAENIRETFWLRDARTFKMLYLSPAYEETWGRTRESLLQDEHNFFNSVHPEDRERLARAQAHLREMQQPLNEEYRILRPDGEIRWIWVRTYPVWDTHGTLTRYAGLAEDITERKRSEEKIAASLNEKEILLRELYHRTKNNMQMIRSMLVLQSVHSNSPEVLELVQATESKIQAMALVHQMLYQSQNLSSIDLQPYIQDLAYLAFSTFQQAPNQITLQLNLESLWAPIDIAIPVGLVLNELLSNSFKHAFPENRPGEICIGLTRCGPEKILLEFSDNGVGVPASLDLRQQPTYGLASVFSIVELQLEGQVEVDTRQGLAYSICFSDRPYQAA